MRTEKNEQINETKKKQQKKKEHCDFNDDFQCTPNAHRCMPNCMGMSECALNICGVPCLNECVNVYDVSHDFNRA